MSNQELNQAKQALAEMQAAHQLMTQWVKDNAGEVAGAISTMVPFICGECNTSDLANAMNVVNIVFANVALDVIKSRNKMGDDSDQCLCLPADACSMQNAIDTLSRFLNKFDRMGRIIENNEKMPAFKLSISSYDQVDSI